jgi:pimeloyl-ACP methyl ester carboxylesterase
VRQARGQGGHVPRFAIKHPLTGQHAGGAMTAGLVLLAVAASVVASDASPPFLAFGGDPARGVLVNLSAGARPDDPAVASRPTLVFIHGFNPAPRTVHFTMSEQVARAAARRHGGTLNVFGWNWSAATFVSLVPRQNGDSAVAQGRALAASLWRAGAAPERTHLVGHSSGTIVAASAARTFAFEHGRPVAQLTLLEPAASYHDVVFERLAAGSAARRVENYWSPDARAYGREAAYQGVENIRVDRQPSSSGPRFPRRSSHMYVVEWYINTIEDGSYPVGFNRSLLLGGGG